MNNAVDTKAVEEPIQNPDGRRSMQVTANDEMAELVHSCLLELVGVEAAFVRECLLREPTVPLREFAKEWGLSAKALNETRERTLLRLKDVMAGKGITSIADVM
jgi:hypothetical protein